MSCQSCKSDRVLSISAKCADLCGGTFKGKEFEGYAPSVNNICKGDYIDVTICLECGQVQGAFPVTYVEEE